MRNIWILFFVFYSFVSFAQIQKIVFPFDTFSNPVYVNINRKNAFIYMNPNKNEIAFGKIYKKNERKWEYNQRIDNVRSSGSGSGGQKNNGVLLNDKLYVVTSLFNNTQENQVIVMYGKRGNLFEPIDTIFPDTASSIANFAIYNDYIFYRDYRLDLSDLSNIKLINSYCFLRRENNEWVRKAKFRYESNTSTASTYISARFAMKSRFAFAGQREKLIIFKREGYNWVKHQEIYNENQEGVNISLIRNLSVSDDEKWLAITTSPQMLIYKLIGDKYVFYEIIPKIDGYRAPQVGIITNNQLLTGQLDYAKENGFILLYELEHDTWTKTHRIEPPPKDTLHYQFGYDIDRYGETVITCSPDWETNPIVHNSAAYIFQIPARDTLNIELCEGGSYTFNDTVITTSGHYVDTLMASYGVDSVVQLYVNVRPAPKVEIDTFICPGDSIKIGEEIFTEEGEYEVMLKSSYGCDSIVQLSLGLSEIELLDSAIISDYGCGSGAIDLSIEGNNPPYAFDWSTGEQGEDISGLTKGTYSVTIWDNSGCELQQSFIVPDSIPYLIPNAFFPSGTEELNKNFKIYQAQNVHIESTQIFDRWGEKVYESQGDEYWDGSYKGKVLAPGVYLYKIVIDSPCGKETETGQVLLLR